MPKIQRFDVLGSRISAVDAEEALIQVVWRLAEGAGGYVCFTNVHTAVTGCQDAAFQAITNRSFMSLADGMPVYWVARVQGRLGHVPGPDFMLFALERHRDRKHFFYGSTPEVLERLKEKLRLAFPDINICGSLSPPFRSLTADEKQQHLSIIKDAGSEFVWVGLGAPKQEQWMAEMFESLRPAILFGVGAAFDFHSESVGRAPKVMRSLGLEWLYRLARQPRRLWRRYLLTNSLFVAFLVRRALSGKRRELS